MYTCTQEHIHNKTPRSDDEKTDMYGNNFSNELERIETEEHVKVKLIL